eukprot:CAMPEP_0175412752 /NCGR_PEP_ID=MMETSP0095-20121207/42799_1 /TAXON_ID=311494 /ORGANISM="Alexandrium monilatum, Strain CCMP3105" /LENGTH=424 /DNA_ID=CAMNT_0016711769 /DNA_START=9 /DNA_END=1283 /DNA_ORIENTATION=-
MTRRTGRKRDRRHGGWNDTQAASGAGCTWEDADVQPVGPAHINGDDAVPEGHRCADFGLVVYDLETTHDAERGTYHEKGIHECAASEQITWKRRSQIIEFAAVDLHSGTRFLSRCRPEFEWSDVRSTAARRFAQDHGHDQIILDESLPHFRERWVTEVMPFLIRAAGSSGRLAMIAHNGDAFDHFVLDKELSRLGLSDALPLEMHRFDTIRTLKQRFGQDYGTCGQLALKALHAQHVQHRVEGELASHQALNDCLMLVEVLSRWQELGELLAQEIANDICEDVQVPAASALLKVRFACPAHTAVRGIPPPPPPLPPQPQHDALAMGGAAAVLLPQPPPPPPAPPCVPSDAAPGGELRLGAVEFVPGVPWTALSGLAAGMNCGHATFEQVSGGGGWPCDEGEAPYWEPLVPPEAERAMVAGMQYQ